MTLAQRDELLTEVMEGPDCDPEKVRRTLRRFRVMNRFVSRWGSVYRAHLRPVFRELSGSTARDRPIRVLDIGCGGGDVLRRIMRMARRDGFEIEAIGIDPDSRAIDVAEAGRQIAGLSFRRSLSRELVEQGMTFDVVISNHLLHHLDDVELADFIHDSEVLAGSLCVHSDIRRGRTAYVLFSIAALSLAPGTYLRVDGLRSIRRSYRTDELHARLPRQWSTEPIGPFRLLAVMHARVPAEAR